MLKKYNSFLLESHIKNLMLLEGYIYGSGEFLIKLKELSKENEIAKSIYNMINRESWVDDSKINQNYFDLTESDDKVSFIQINKLPEDWDDEDDPSLPYEIPRNEIKVGRAIRYLFDIYKLDKPSDKEIEHFVNAFKASKAETEREFKLVSGTDIANYYHEDNYYNMNGSLGGSCMSDEGKKMFKIYTKNSEKIKLLVLLDKKDRVHGRALVWKLDKYPDGGARYFMDRVYTNSDSDDLKFKKFAREKEWMCKYRNNAHISDNVKFVFNGKLIYGEVSLELDGDFSKYPFIDTICFLSKKKDRLSNIPDKKDWFLHDVEGLKERCESCDGKIIYISWSQKRLCSNCGSGHDVLKEQGIETKWNAINLED
jgi:hypothetical protein